MSPTAFPLRTAKMKISCQLKILSSDNPHLLWCLKIIFLRPHGETQEHFNWQPKDEEYMGEVPILQQRLPYNTHYLMHDVKDYRRNQSNNYKHEQLENAVQEHQRSAASATSRTAAHVTSRFRHIENVVEADFSIQQRGLLSDITSKSVQELEAQRHTLAQEATAEMIRRDAHKSDTLFQLRSVLQHYHLHAEG